MATKPSLLLKLARLNLVPCRNIDHTTSITKRQKKVYVQMYPTVLQFPDGSTINIPYHEPVGKIQLPLDLNTLSEEEKKARLRKRIPKTKVVIQDEIEDDFDASRYLKK
ncbi:hypothetical protein QAD02_010240 [Eretmocerus hayati]|uniref:Uncharacterized protein n=1 Tax=Eretmocerus hayati TaxID=131215 RepID=A0ACC2NE83_9HYME|nr:hypothetical protein QAD02_010240 [Eretmocerus hayati]